MSIATVLTSYNVLDSIQRCQNTNFGEMKGAKGCHMNNKVLRTARGILQSLPRDTFLYDQSQNIVLLNT